MSYIGVKINGLIQKMAGMPLMDVAFSNRSTNGVQNKVLKAKFDEIESDFSDHVITITADGVKSSAVLISELMSALANVYLNGKKLNVIGAVLPQLASGRVGLKCESLYLAYGVAPSALQFSTIQPGTGGLRITAFNADIDASNVRGYLGTMFNTTGISDISTIVPSSGMILEIHYKLTS